MNGTDVSHAELRRSAREALRVLGYSIAQAEEGAECLGWTEAAYGNGLQFLAHEGARRSTLSGESVEVSRGDPTEIHVNGRSILEIGHRVFDFIQAETQKSATGLERFAVRTTFGSQFIPFHLRRLARWGSCVEALIWPLDHISQRAVLRGFAWGEQLLWRPLEENLRLDDESELDIEIVCAAQSPEAVDWDPSDTLGDPRVGESVSKGIVVSTEGYQHFLELQRGLRAPTSVRSRGQAG